MNKLNLKEWITTKEACQLVDRTRTTIASWVNEGLVRKQYVGEKPLFNKNDLIQARNKKDSHY